MDFEEWFESRDDIGCLIGLEGYAAEQAWNARQAEIDALKKIISESLDWLDASHSKQDDAIKRAKSKLRGIK